MKKAIITTLLIAVAFVAGYYFNSLPKPKLGALQTTGENSFSMVTTSTAVTASTTSAQILAANTNRQYARITNLGTDSVYLGFATTSVIGKGIVVASGGSYEINPLNEFKGAVNAIASTTANSLAIVEK